MCRHNDASHSPSVSHQTSEGDRKKTLEILIYLFKTHFEFLGLVLLRAGGKRIINKKVSCDRNHLLARSEGKNTFLINHVSQLSFSPWRSPHPRKYMASKSIY